MERIRNICSESSLQANGRPLTESRVSFESPAPHCAEREDSSFQILFRKDGRGRRSEGGGKLTQLTSPTKVLRPCRFSFTFLLFTVSVKVIQARCKQTLLRIRGFESPVRSGERRLASGQSLAGGSPPFRRSWAQGVRGSTSSPRRSHSIR